MQTHRSSDSLKDTRTLVLMPSRHVISACHSSVNILQPQMLPLKSRTVSTSWLLPQASAPPRRNQVEGEMSEITHPTNVSAFPPQETVTGIVTGTETGKGTGIETEIGGNPPADATDLPRHGSGTENGRETLRGGHTRKTKKRRSHQSRCLPLYLGLLARCLSR